MLDNKTMSDKNKQPAIRQHKVYRKPAIIHELELETRAGTVIPPFGPLDLTGTDGSSSRP